MRIINISEKRRGRAVRKGGERVYHFSGEGTRREGRRAWREGRWLCYWERVHSFERTYIYIYIHVCVYGEQFVEEARLSNNE